MPELHRRAFQNDAFVADRAAHIALSDDYETRYLRGESEAIFEYVSLDTWAFRASWVIEQIELWRDRGEFTKLHRLMKRYTRARGRTSSTEFHRIITRDQANFESMLAYCSAGMTSKKAIEMLADDLWNGEDAFKDENLRRVYREYRCVYDQAVPSRFSPEEFFAELSRMADRLKPLTIAG